MLKIKRLSRAKRHQITIFFCWLLTMPLFQNCGGDFKAAKFQAASLTTEGSSTGSGSGAGAGSGSQGDAGSQPAPSQPNQPSQPVTLNGKLLYATNCAVCHGALESSTKKLKTAAQISSAIRDVPSMKSQVSLTALSNSQILAIESALKGESGMVQDPNPADPTKPPPMNQTPVGVCMANAVRGVSKEGVRRLSRDELMASLNAIIPGVSQTLKPFLDTYPDTDVVEEVEKYDPLHSKAQVLQWTETVDALADIVIKNRSFSGIGGQCLQSVPVSEACWREFFTNVGKRVYRRPLSSNEVTTLATLANQRQASAGTEAAIYASVHLLFRSPAFLFHFEVGVAEETGRVRLSDHEVANRISFGLLGTPPDAQLTAAADAGQLRTLAQVEAQVRRLVETDGAKTKLKKFFSEWLQLSHVQLPQNEYMTFFKNIQGNGNMDNAMVQEIQDYLFYTFWKKRGTFNDLMTQTIAFPRFHGLHYANGGKPYSVLAMVYNQDAYSGFTPERQEEANVYPAPNHPGLLTRAGFLSSSRYETQPITRGVFVQRRILCEPLPSPDFSVVSQRLAEVGDPDPMMFANHQRVTHKTGGAACVSCHSKINPVGFALEGYDMLGIPRQKEEVLDLTKFYSEKKGVVATHALPNPVSGVIIGEKTITVSSPFDLASEVANSNRAKLCLSTFMLRHFDRRRENGGDSCGLSEATQVMQQDKPVLDVFVKTLANEDIFWRRK